METKLPGRNFCRAGYTSRGCPLLSVILAIAGVFDTGSCQKFKQEILVEFARWKGGGGGRVEEWQGFFRVLEYVTH